MPLVPTELSVLTAMITPAVLISACAGLILSTSVRLGRVVDRVRALSERFEDMVRRRPEDVPLYEDRLEMTFVQLDWLTSRARHLQRAMTTFYLSLGVFVATSVAIGITAAAGGRYAIVPMIFGMFGVGLLFFGTILLGFEATLALRSIHAEMDLLWKLGRHHAPEELRARLPRRIWPLR
jgi:hypothetical protein